MSAFRSQTWQPKVEETHAVDALTPVIQTVIQPLWQTEKHAIEQAIEACNGNIVKAAALLEISPSTIYRKMAGWEENGLTR